MTKNAQDGVTVFLTVGEAQLILLRHCSTLAIRHEPGGCAVTLAGSRSGGHGWLIIARLHYSHRFMIPASGIPGPGRPARDRRDRAAGVVTLESLPV